MSDKQPFLGTVVTGVAAKAAVAVVDNIAEKILKGPSVPVSDSQASSVASEIAKKAAPAVVEAMKADPVIKTAINGEPWYQSIIFWLSSGGGAASAWALLELWVQQPPASMSLWVAALGTFFTSVGVLLRRLQFVPGK